MRCHLNVGLVKEADVGSHALHKGLHHGLHPVEVTLALVQVHQPEDIPVLHLHHGVPLLSYHLADFYTVLTERTQTTEGFNSNTR